MIEDLSKILVRDNLDDHGEIPSTGATYSSPDIIVHKDIADPYNYLADKYQWDINQRAYRGVRTNLIYGRVKNLGDTDVSGYLRLYRSPSTCFMQPSLWKDNVLSSPEFENGGSVPYTRFHAKAGKVTACEYPLILDGKVSDNFCIVGIVGGVEETVPDNFRTYDDFLEWVHQNRTVAIRNLNVLTCAEVSDYEGSYLFSNPESYESPCFIDVVYDKVPVGINVNVASEMLHVRSSETLADTSGHYGIAAYIPPKTSGAIVLRVKSPSGAGWPSQARIEVRVLVGRNVNNSSYVYGLEPGRIFTKDTDMTELMTDRKMRLVSVGACGICTE